MLKLILVEYSETYCYRQRADCSIIRSDVCLNIKSHPIFMKAAIIDTFFVASMFQWLMSRSQNFCIVGVAGDCPVQTRALRGSADVLPKCENGRAVDFSSYNCPHGQCVAF